LRAAGELLQNAPKSLEPRAQHFAEMVVSYNQGRYHDAVGAAQTIISGMRQCQDAKVGCETNAFDERLFNVSVYIVAASDSEAGLTKDAFYFANDAITAGLRNSDLYFIRGVSNPDVRKGIEDLTAAYRLAEKDPRILTWRGFLYTKIPKAPDFLSAIRDAEEAVNDFGDCGPAYTRTECAKAYNNLGWARMRYVEESHGASAEMQTAAKDAEAVFTKGIGFDPTYGTIYANRAWARNELRRYTDARDDATRAITLMVGSEDQHFAYSERARSFRGLGLYELAAQDSAEAKREPGSDPAKK
jgi:tetratricopeptide (TPR) repeat protein